MRAMMLVLVLVLVAGCSSGGGSAEDGGSSGPVWVDANGTVVAPVTGPAAPEFFDAQGRVWALDPKTGKAASLLPELTMINVFTSNDCSTAGVWLPFREGAGLNPPPGTVLFAAGRSGVVFASIHDDAKAAVYATVSLGNSGTCYSSIFGEALNTFADAQVDLITEAEVPVAGFKPPFRQKQR